MHEKDELVYRRFLKERGENDLRLLLERHKESLMLFLLGYVHSMEDAEELMMDAFAVVASGTSAFSERSSFRTWLFGIARNQARMLLRKKRGFSASLDEEGHTQEADTPELALLRQEKNRELYLALEALPEDYRQALYLLYFEDMDAEEAAHVMGKTKKQIYNLTQRGKNALREVLERMGFDDAQYR